MNKYLYSTSIHWLILTGTKIKACLFINFKWNWDVLFQEAKHEIVNDYSIFGNIRAESHIGVYLSSFFKQYFNIAKISPTYVQS